MKIVLATKNRGKIKEFRSLLEGFGHEVVSLLDLGEVPDVEEDGATFMENAVKKARGYCEATGMACLADDSGLEVGALGGAPGVRSARFAGPGATDEENNRKLLTELESVPDQERTARFRCCLALWTPDGRLLTAEGSCEGRITREPVGEGGFGYDPIFYVEELGRTMAQLSAEEKNRISHRGRAIEALRPKLASFLGRAG